MAYCIDIDIEFDVDVFEAERAEDEVELPKPWKEFEVEEHRREVGCSGFGGDDGERLERGYVSVDKGYEVVACRLDGVGPVLGCEDVYCEVGQTWKEERGCEQGLVAFEWDSE